MQRIPPFDRKINDRHVDRAYQREDGGRLVGTTWIVDRGGKRQIAQIKEKQDQFRSQACVPYPPRAPGWPAPECTGPQRDECHQGTGRRQRVRHHRRQACIECQADTGPERHDHVDEHRHPRRRHMDENDAIGVALLKVRGRGEQRNVQADHRENDGDPHEPGHHFSGQRIEGLRRGILQPVHIANLFK